MALANLVLLSDAPLDLRLKSNLVADLLTLVGKDT